DYLQLYNMPKFSGIRFSEESEATLFFVLLGNYIVWRNRDLMKLKEVIYTGVQEQLLSRLEQLLGDYRIAELNCALLKNRAHFSIVLFHPEGVSLDACAELHKIIDVELERIQARGALGNYNLELSSPGLGRRLRSLREFQVFRGQPIRCMVGDSWHKGTLLGLAEDTWDLSLQNAREILRFSLEEVVKVELDS
ncbi:MAG: hypothetical protein AAF975_03500, partial [Spirochaetota bacterium]